MQGPMKCGDEALWPWMHSAHSSEQGKMNYNAIGVYIYIDISMNIKEYLFLRKF